MYGWIQAMDEAMVTHHLGVADEYDSYDTARRKLNELIDWHVAVATDPRVNGGWQLVPVDSASSTTSEIVVLDDDSFDALDDKLDERNDIAAHKAKRLMSRKRRWEDE